MSHYNFNPNSYFMTLDAAAYDGNINLVREFLTESTSHINDINPGGNFALGLAAQQGHLEVVRILLDHGATIDLQRNGMTALVLATIAGQTEVVHELLGRGANPLLAKSYFNENDNFNYFLDRHNILDLFEEYINTEEKQKAAASFYSGESKTGFFLPKVLVNIIDDYTKPTFSSNNNR
jgi:ankyrin repeat protein